MPDTRLSPKPLPGYNFPRLPLYAFVPGEGKAGSFLQRARFLAISEFGPRSLIYHEGRAYRVPEAIEIQARDLIGAICRSGEAEPDFPVAMRFQELGKTILDRRGVTHEEAGVDEFDGGHGKSSVHGEWTGPESGAAGGL